jgi:D-glycero-D-manno-heptose 1,7-bisphosphate phosphatase
MENKTEKTEIRVISYGKENLQNDEETRLRLLENKVRHYKDYLDHKPKKNKVAFLDRDGILNVDKGYLYKIEDLEWMPHVKEGIGLLCNLGFKVVVVTNQSGIARGYYTVADMEKLHAYMEQEIEKEKGKISHFYYCPHLQEGTVPEYAVACDCRKPKPGMILQGIRDFNADLERSFVIGDSDKDLQAAEAAHLRGYLYTGGDMQDFFWEVVQHNGTLADVKEMHKMGIF